MTSGEDVVYAGQHGQNSSEAGDVDVPEDWIVAAQGWAWTVGSLGGLGNLVTICTILHQLYLRWAWKRRRCSASAAIRPVVPLEGDTLLLLHLSLCDFLYCAVNLPITAFTYNYALGNRLVAAPSKTFCSGAALFRYVNALAEWTTLGLLTVQRCVDLGRSRGARFFRPRPTLCFILFIWVASVLLQMGAVAQGLYDYDNKTYKCDMVDERARIYFYSLETLVPCGLMLTGCFSIIYQIWRNTRKLRAAGMSQELAAQRFRSMLKSTALLLGLLFLFLTCIIPICVYNIATLVTGLYNVPLGIGVYMIYWIQYGVNFLVYAASNGCYRRAYKQFFSLLSGLVTFTPASAQDMSISHHQNSHSHTQRSPDKVPPCPDTTSAIPQAHRAVAALAILPLSRSGAKGFGHPLPPLQIPNIVKCPPGPHLHTLHSLKNCPLPNDTSNNTIPTSAREVKACECQRRVHTLPASACSHFWYSSMWSNGGSQSSGSSELTMESTICDGGAPRSPACSVFCTSGGDQASLDCV